MADHSENLISAYLDNQLGADERAQFEERLRQDAELRELTESLKSQSEQLHSLPKFSLDANFSQRLLQDARIAHAFEESDAAIKPTAATKPLSNPATPINWRYAAGVIASLAALVLITAFLVIPNDLAPNVATNMDSTERAPAPSALSATEDEEAFDDGRSNADSPMSMFAEKKAGAGDVSPGAVSGSKMDNFSTRSESGADASRQFQAQAAQEEMPKPGDDAFAGGAKMQKGVPKGNINSKTMSPRQSADVRSRQQLSQPADKLESARAMKLPTADAIESDALAVQEAEAANLFLPAKTIAGDVIEINFSATDKNVDHFVKSLEKNSIAFDVNAQLANSKSNDDTNSQAGLGKTRGGGGGRPSGSKKEAPDVFFGSMNQRAFFVEATEQQMLSVVADLQPYTTVVKQRSSDTAVQQVLDQIAPARRSENAAGQIDDSSLKSAKQAMFANAREIRVPEIKEMNEPKKILNQLKLKDSKLAGSQQEQAMLRKYIVLLNMAEALEGSADASEAAVSPSDK